MWDEFFCGDVHNRVYTLRAVINDGAKKKAILKITGTINYKYPLCSDHEYYNIGT